MSQPSFTPSAPKRGMHLTVPMCFALAVQLTALLPCVTAEEPSTRPGRRVSVFFELHENQPAGTLVTRLLDHHLTLSNFRISVPESDPVFSVDSHDGSVRIDRDDSCDFESSQNLRLLVSADEKISEDDQFLKQFSAGLLEDGLAAGVVESLSANTVTLEITIRLRDVPEPPTLTDVDLLVPVSAENSVVMGTVAPAKQPSSEVARYFIVSGNEDNLFEIDSDTGVLTLHPGNALKSDMISTHDLQILAETSAGLAATATAVITVFNETPIVLPPAAGVIASVPDEPAAPIVNGSALSSLSTGSDELPFRLTLKLHHVPEFRFPLRTEVDSSDTSAALEDSAERTVAEDTEPGFVLPTLAAPVLNRGPIDTIELRDWLTPEENTALSSAVGRNPASDEETSTQNSASASPFVASTGPSQKILQSVMALIVFVVSCVAGAIALSRASAARRSVIAEEAERQTDELAAERRCFEELTSSVTGEAECSESMTGAEVCTEVAVHDKQEKFGELSEQIRVLQSELAARDQMIADLQARLNSVPLNSAEPAAIIGNPEPSEPDSLAGDRQPDAYRTPDSVPPLESLSQILQHVESHSAFKSEPDIAQEQHGFLLTGITQSLPVWDMAVESKMDRSPQAEDSITATLDDQEALRAELAELFSIRQSKTSPSPPTIQTVKEDENKPHAVEPDRSENGLNDEDSHLDSVKQYLSQLLDRSKDARSAEDILVDRRKAESPNLTADRRSASEPGRKPVKSFLESYMSAHGVSLEATRESSTPETSEKKAPAPLPDKPRTPIDVKSARESMNSFRAVAIQSVENAVLSHDMRQAKGAIAVRTMMLAGLILVTTFAFLANMLDVIQFSLLPWLMAAAVIFVAIELGLRIQSIRKQRRELLTGKLNADARPPKRRIKKHDLDDTLVQ